jgi:hypothetical protein
MDGVKEAHLGVIQAKEFLPLITDASGNIRKSLFYDNVRDFQDYNDVNKDIRATLQSAQREHFVLLNNGVTLIASSLRVVGNKITIEDYQVVNGCQTCHVIFDCRALIGDDVYVPIKVIATDDELLTSAIIKGTNRQTQVKTAQLYALTEFQKRLETYFNTFKGPQALYYERRSKQHSGSSVEKVRIVSIQQEMRCFAAMFLDEAHRGHYPRSLQPYVGTKLFNEKHRLEPYYVSAYSQYRLEYFFRSSQLPAGLKPARYHLLMVARHLASGPRLPSMHSNKMGRKCEKLMETFWDDAKALALFKRAATVIDKAVSKRPLNRELTKTQPFTEDVLKAL